ncbi:MAG TPA: zinc ribbon domain-containing protein [Steroidobacteraceae bacterium]|nr:zinc ribbon domain-containing protein [Steroidobacteraceae bacterium]
MSLTTCPKCGAPIADGVSVCPGCGQPLSGNPARRIALACALGLMAAGLGAAVLMVRTPADGARNARAVHSGQREQVAFFYDLLANCEVEGYPEITVVRGPDAGAVSVQKGKAYPRYTRENIRFECDRNPADAMLVFYQSNAGYRGRDSFTITVRFPDSEVWTESYGVNVF